ncbi:hypothetical protein ACH4GK_00865 [Streptomyces rimosus]|uniref:hypothetical protein n=1 Tax=Streptomyces rimosus TaxID=1927 RepID=UPI00131D4C8A|nr:hypothetical protein [Streptomyces rimosus]
MKLHRIAAAVATAAMAPALMLSAPAVAAGNPAGAKTGAQSAATTAARPIALSLKGPENVTAGAWTDLRLTLDNRAGETVDALHATVETYVKANDFKAGDSELEYRAKDGSWRQAESIFMAGDSYRIEWGQVEKGAVFTIDLRVRYAPHVAGSAVIMSSVGSDAKLLGEHTQPFDVVPADGAQVPAGKVTDHRARVAFRNLSPGTEIRTGDDWREFQLVMDHRRGEADIAKFERRMLVGLGGRTQPGQVQVEYRDAPNAPWRPWKVTSHQPMSAVGSLGSVKLAKGELRTTDIRLRIASGAPTGGSVVFVDGFPEKTSDFRRTTRFVEVTAG